MRESANWVVHVFCEEDDCCKEGVYLFCLVSIEKNNEATAWFWFASWPVIRETFETIFVKRMIVVRKGCILFNWCPSSL